MAVSKMHHLKAERTHARWKPSLEPVLEVDAGDVVVMECKDGFDGQASPPVTARDLDENLYGTIDFRRVAPLTGPVAVRGAEPGDTLEVRILDLVATGTASVVIFPSWMDNDFLSKEQRSDFPDAWIRSFDMDEAASKGAIDLTESVRIPLRPMMGMMGTAPAEGDFTTTGPPRHFGGNMDIKDVAKGNLVYLPVYRPGALFSTGDAHAMQGDGEMCTTGLETPATVTVEFRVHKGRTIPGPQIETHEEFMTVAYGRTLEQASQRAMRFMIDYLVERQGLDPYGAYALLSLACDLRVNQVVDFPHLGVRVAVPKRTFKVWKW